MNVIKNKLIMIREGVFKMAKMYYNGDANAELLNGKTVAVIGFGSQGHAHSLNMKESGVNVIVGLRKGNSWDDAVEAWI